MRAFIGLGSNIGNGKALLQRALDELDQQASIEIIRQSNLYCSAPWGVENQPDFTNAVAEAETAMMPESLLTVLQAIEAKLGRKRDSGHWGPRTIDLDLLCCDQLVIQSEKLILPHPHMHERAFVLVPLLELAPEFQIPALGSARDCLAKLPDQGVRRLP